MLITNRNKPAVPLVKIGAQALECKNNIKFLGVLFDCKLKFNFHTRYIGDKISRSLGILYSIRELVPYNTLRTLYFTLIASDAEFAKQTQGESLFMGHR